MSSRNWLRFDIPGFVIANHDVNDRQEFAHTSDDGDLLKFVAVDQPLIESFDHRIGTNSRQSSHVELAAHLGAAASYVPSATLLAAVPIDRCHADELRDLVPIKLA